MNFVIKKFVAPVVLLTIAVFAWVNAVSLDNQSGKNAQVFSDQNDSTLSTSLF